MAPRDKKGILFILRAVVQSYLSVLCVHSRLTSVLLRFILDYKFQRGGGTESYVCEQTFENQSRQLPESALWSRYPHSWTSLVAQTAKNPPAMQETCVWSLSWEDSLERDMETHSIILAWIIPWRQDPGLLSMGSQRDGHNWVTKHTKCWSLTPSPHVTDFGDRAFRW